MLGIYLRFVTNCCFQFGMLVKNKRMLNPTNFPAQLVCENFKKSTRSSRWLDLKVGSTEHCMFHVFIFEFVSLNFKYYEWFFSLFILDTCHFVSFYVQ